MTVYLVGAGPGDPRLLTLRADALLRVADVVLYDRLVDPAALAGVRGAAVVRNVEEWREHGTGQQAINQQLVEFGQRYQIVVRLKGGDPFLFGRGGEEAQALEAAGIDYEVVPGVTSAVGVPTAAGLPVTHRGVASSVTVVTGHQITEGSAQWEAIARTEGTVVVVMGAASRGAIGQILVAAGRSPQTPVAIIEQGTTAAERIERCELAALGDLDVAAPAIMVVGPVAALDFAPTRSRLLRGTRIVVTRGQKESSQLAAQLRDLGAQVLVVPATTTRLPGDSEFAQAVSRLADYDWIVLTSARAVAALLDGLDDVRQLATCRLAVVGAATAGSLAAAHLQADVVATESSGAGLAAMFEPGQGRVLFPVAVDAGDDLAEGLRAKGYIVDRIGAYRTVALPQPGDDIRRWVEAADLVVFAAPSAVASVSQWLVSRPTAVAIGPTTAKAAKAAHYEEVFEAGSADDAGLSAAVLEAVFSRLRSQQLDAP